MGARRIAAATAVVIVVAGLALVLRAGTVVFGGDLDVGSDRVLAVWPEGWTELDQELRPTRPVPDPRRKIDFVLLSPDLRSVDARVLDVPRCPSSRLEDRWCTDHHPVAGTVTMGGTS